MKTISALFDNYDDARDAVAELEATGVPEQDLSIVASNSDNSFEDDDSSAAAEGAAGGAGIGAVVGGAGGLLTGLVYAEGIRRGGALVTARVSDELAVEAQRILRRPTAVDLASRRRDYESEGWTEFDPGVPPRDASRTLP